MSETLVIYDSRLCDLISPNAELQRLAEGAKHSEGPVYLPEDDSVIWSDVSGNRVFRWSAQNGTQVLREPSDYQNGNCLDLEGRLVSCSHGKRAIVRREHSGEWQILVDRYRSKRLNSPNDIVAKSDGTLWFTDPPFGLTQPDEGYGEPQEQPGSFVFRFDPSTGEIDAVIREMERPNGLAFSPGEKILYVSDTSQVNYAQGHHYVRAYTLINEKQVTNGQVFTVIEPGQPDGLKVDAQGNLFIASADSIQVHAPDRTCLGKILVPEVCANLAFGGRDGKRLFITAGCSLYAIDLRR